MISKKVICFTLLFYLSPLSGCLKLIDLTKKPTEPLQLSFGERQAKYEQDAEAVKKILHERRNARLITGFSPAGTTFLYSLYTAKRGADFDNALSSRGEFFVQLYAQERVEECSALGIVMLAESVSFTKKKKFIQELVGGVHYDEFDHVAKYTFTPTIKDQEFAFFVKVKEFASLIIQEISTKILLIRHMNEELQLLDALLDKGPIVRYMECGKQLLAVRKYIAELLFLLQLEEQESLL